MLAVEHILIVINSSLVSNLKIVCNFQISLFEQWELNVKSECFDICTFSYVLMSCFGVERSCWIWAEKRPSCNKCITSQILEHVVLPVFASLVELSRLLAPSISTFEGRVPPHLELRWRNAFSKYDHFKQRDISLVSTHRDGSLWNVYIAPSNQWVITVSVVLDPPGCWQHYQHQLNYSLQLFVGKVTPVYQTSPFYRHLTERPTLG